MGSIAVISIGLLLPWLTVDATCVNLVLNFSQPSTNSLIGVANPLVESIVVIVIVKVISFHYAENKNRAVLWNICVDNAVANANVFQFMELYAP